MEDKKDKIYKIINWVLVLGFITFLIVAKCSETKKEKQTSKVVKKAAIEIAIDSTKVKSMQDSIDALNNLLKRRESTIIKQSKKITKLTVELDESLSNYYESDNRTPKCDSLAEDAKMFEVEAKVHIDTLNQQLKDEKEKTRIALSMYNQKANLANNLYSNVQYLAKQSERTWLERNDSWLSFLGGMAFQFGASKIWK